MYLDKPMRDHVLLQAIARVNRPYEDSQGKAKPSGFVLDFVGIFENLEKALAFDSSDIEGVIKDLGILKGLFVTLIAEGQEKYLSIAKGKKRDKAIEALLTHFLDEEARHEFYQFFKTISEIYDILSPDAFLRPYVEDMEKLARLYKILKDNFEPGISVDREFSRKTAKLVQKHSDSTDIRETTGIYEIDEKLIWHLEESEASDIEKVFNLIKSIQRTVEKYAGSSPVLVSIGEKAERIVQAYKDRQKSTQETLEELKKIVEEINEARAEQEKMNMTVDTFAIFWIMKKERIENPEGKARDMKTVLDSYPHWRESEKQEREVRSSLYRIVLASGKPNVQEAKETVTTIIRVLRQASE
jgi:type I restriction enzyme R subunit